MATDTESKTSNGSSNGARVFPVRKAVRKSVPIWIGLGGGSGGGKTLSALRLATGIQRVVGGKVFVIDTEADRAEVYAPKGGMPARPPESFDFEQVTFEAPFSSLDYLAAIRQCYDAGARVVIIDSFSHEHESSGGVLEQFEEEVERLSGGDDAKAERIKMLAWKKPKAGRRKMINAMLQMKISVIGCFRTKNGLELQKGKEPKKMGEIPVTGDGLIYEFPLRMLLKAGSDGRPTLETPYDGERGWIRVPQFFRHLISSDKQLDEVTGEEIAKWAAGAVDENNPYVRLTRAIASARDRAALEAIRVELAEIPKTKAVPASEFKILKEAFAVRANEVAALEKEHGYDDETGEVTEPASEKGAA